jgi:hypothetical protein
MLAGRFVPGFAWRRIEPRLESALDKVPNFITGSAWIEAAGAYCPSQDFGVLDGLRFDEWGLFASFNLGNGRRGGGGDPLFQMGGVAFSFGATLEGGVVFRSHEVSNFPVIERAELMAVGSISVSVETWGLDYTFNKDFGCRWASGGGGWTCFR